LIPTLEMNINKHRDIYYNPIDQKIWRTSKLPTNNNFELIGTLSLAEYEFFINLLYNIYDDEYISTNQVQKIYNDFKNFLDTINNT